MVVVVVVMVAAAVRGSSRYYGRRKGKEGRKGWIGERGRIDVDNYNYSVVGVYMLKVVMVVVRFETGQTTITSTSDW